MTRLRNTTVLLICGASDVGNCLATQCAQQGAKVVLWDPNGLRSQHLATELRRFYGVTASAYQVDITKANQVIEAAAAVKRDFREVNVLIYGVDLLHNKEFAQQTSDELVETLDLNVLGMIRVVKELLPLMAETKTGHIVTISSCVDMLHTSRVVDYCASKAALTGFHNSLRDELQRDPRTKGSVRMTLMQTTFSCHLVDDAKNRHVPKLSVLMKPEEFARRVVKAIKKDEQEVMYPPHIPWIRACLALFAPAPAEWFREKLQLSTVTQCLRTPNSSNSSRRT